MLNDEEPHSVVRCVAAAGGRLTRLPWLQGSSRSASFADAWVAARRPRARKYSGVGRVAGPSALHAYSKCSQSFGSAGQSSGFAGGIRSRLRIRRIVEAPTRWLTMSS